MCLAVPGRVVRWLNREALFAQAEIDFGGVRRVCHMGCVTEAEEGDYVIVHAGVAISRIDEAAARQSLEELLGPMNESGAPPDDGSHPGIPPRSERAS